MFPHLSLKSSGRLERFSFCEGSRSLKQVACSLPAHSLITRPLLTTFLRAHKCAHQHTNVHNSTQMCTTAQKLCAHKSEQEHNKFAMLVIAFHLWNLLFLLKPFTRVEDKMSTKFGQTLTSDNCKSWKIQPPVVLPNQRKTMFV